MRYAFRDFRNLEEDELFPCEEVNVIYGGNAQGKTNLLEGLWLFTGGHSFRGAKDGELPRLDPETGKNASGTALELDFFSEDREQNVMLQIDGGRRTSWINEVKKNSGSALVGKVRAVIFSPEHLMLIKEGPPHRRKFLDTALCQIKPSYAQLISSYRRALSQRNALLKEIAKNPSLSDTVSIWDAKIASLGSRVMEQRKGFIRRLRPHLQEIFGGIGRGREQIEMTYAPSFKCPEEDQGSREETESLFLQELARTLSSDVRTGFTSAGPHRDDIEISINGVSAKAYGSQGQQRSAVLAMKLAEAKILAEFSGETPIVLLDDVLSELDKARQDYLLNQLHGQQVFITCCEPEVVSAMETGMRFQVQAGTVYPEEVYLTAD